MIEIEDLAPSSVAHHGAAASGPRAEDTERCDADPSESSSPDASEFEARKSTQKTVRIESAHEKSDAPVSIPMPWSHPGGDEEQLRRIGRQLEIDRSTSATASGRPASSEPKSKQRITRMDHPHCVPPESLRQRTQPSGARRSGGKSTDSGSLRGVLFSVGATGLVCGTVLILWAWLDPAQRGLLLLGAPFTAAGTVGIAVAGAMTLWLRMARPTEDVMQERRRRLLERLSGDASQLLQTFGVAPDTIRHPAEKPDPKSLLGELRKQLDVLSHRFDSPPK